MATLTDELSAVNTMLSSISETPVNTLLNTNNVVDVSIAIKLLARTSRAFQAKGWHFNTEYDYPITPDVDGYINLPATTLSVDTESINHGQMDVVQRGMRLYDRKARSYNLDQTVKVSITLLLDFSELPEIAKQYIEIRATRLFQQKMLGSTTLDSFTAEEERDAWVQAMNEEGITADHNIFDNVGLASAIMR
tara:strand:- start:857 stop:1435 length:579 start_codon:yes stop_codon:yes gene_type:complete